MQSCKNDPERKTNKPTRIEEKLNWEAKSNAKFVDALVRQQIKTTRILECKRGSSVTSRDRLGVDLIGPRVPVQL